MSQLRVFWTGQCSSDESVNYQDYAFETWEVTDGLLIVHQTTGPRYIPLMNIRSFKELDCE